MAGAGADCGMAGAGRGLAGRGMAGAGCGMAGVGCGMAGAGCGRPRNGQRLLSLDHVSITAMCSFQIASNSNLSCMFDVDHNYF